MIDKAKIKVKAGNGGNGIVSFRREKYISKGGPWGGDGGRGGNLLLEVDPHLNTLTAFRRKREYKAPDGENGMKKRMKGHDGEDLVIKVPPGTVVKDENSNILYDMTDDGQTEIIANGGRGGLGNWHFKSSTNRTPMKATLGQTTEQLELNLELKLIADVGIIGLPSSGKSTLLNTLTKSNVKTAEYHFTTLEPNLGVLKLENYIPGNESTLVLADIPGLIEGASEGKGLGHEFLKHIERTKVLIHLIDGAEVLNYSPEKLLDNYKTIQNELKTWAEELYEKPQLVAINKSDLTEVKETMEEIKKIFEKKLGIKPIFISAAGYENLEMLVQNTLDIYKSANEKTVPQKVEKKMKEYNFSNLPNRRITYSSEVS